MDLLIMWGLGANINYWVKDWSKEVLAKTLTRVW